MPLQTTIPPFSTARNAATTSGPTGAKMMAASSGAGGTWPESPAKAAEGAFATGPTQPRNADARAGGKPFRAFTALDHFTDDFVSRHKREFRPSQFAIENVQVGPAHRAGAHPDENLAPLRLRHR